MLFNPDLAAGQITFPEDRGDDKPVSRWSVRRVGFIVALVFSLLFALVAGTFAFFVSFAVELPFVRGQVAGTIEQALGAGYEATVGGAILAVDPVLGLVVKVSDVEIVDIRGNQVARLPTTMIAVHPGALFTSRNAIRSIEIDNAWLSIRHEGDVAYFGAVVPAEVEMAPAVPIELAAAATPPTETAPAANPPGAAAVEAIERELPAGFAGLASAIEALNRTLEEAMALAGRGFDSLALYNTTIEIWRPGADTPHRFERADLQFTAAPADGRLSATMTASGYSGRWSMSADRVSNPTTGGETLTLRFSQLTLADFFPAVGRDPSVITTNIPLYGRAILAIDADGQIWGADGRLDFGSGYFAFGPDAKPMLLDHATVRLVWDVAAERINVLPSPFAIGNGGATITGEIRPDGPGRYAFDLESTDALLAPRDSPAPPLPVDLIRLAGTVDVGAGLLHLDRASVATQHGSLVAAGSIGLERGGPSIALAATLSEMPVSVFKQLWPPGLGDGARDWTLWAVSDGMVSGTLEAEIPAGIFGVGGELTTEMFRMELLLSDVDFTTSDGFPNVLGASGRAVFAGSHFAIDLDQGTMPAPNGQVLDLTAATFVIDELASTVPTGHLEMTAAGPTQAFAAIADDDPIRALQPFGVAPEDVTGTGVALMSAQWPLIEGLLIDEVQWRIALTLEDFATEVPLEGMMIANGQLFADITPTIVDVRGTADIDGVTAALDFAFPLVEELDGRQQLQMVLDEGARERLGFNLEGFLGGTVTANVTDLGENGPGQRYELDLTLARVSLPPLGWSKPAGTPATMTFDLVPREGGQLIRDLVLVGEGFGLTGFVELDENSAITRAEITDFALNPGDSARFTFVQDGAGWAVDLVGESFDVREAIAGAVFDTGGGEVTDISIRGRFDQMIGFNGERLLDAEFTFISQEGRIRRIDISGTTQSGTPVVATYDTASAGAPLYVYVGDAGALLRFSNIYARAQGGEITAVGGMFSDGSVYGNIAMTDFNVVDEPAFARLMAQPEPGAQAVAHFDVLEFEFIQNGTVISLQDAVLRGRDMGAVGAGWIDMSAGQISLSGTYIPQYEFNNLFGRIPLLGLALGAGPNEGLFGITFQISGPMDNATMHINPLSAIAPGIFRKIFTFQ